MSCHLGDFSWRLHSRVLAPCCCCRCFGKGRLEVHPPFGGESEPPAATGTVSSSQSAPLPPSSPLLYPPLAFPPHASLALSLALSLVRAPLLSSRWASNFRLCSQSLYPTNLHRYLRINRNEPIERMLFFFWNPESETSNSIAIETWPDYTTVRLIWFRLLEYGKVFW